MKPRSEATRLTDSANLQDLSSLIVEPREGYTTYLQKQIARFTHQLGCRQSGNIDQIVTLARIERQLKRLVSSLNASLGTQIA
jgi:hypothetical protein